MRHKRAAIITATMKKPIAVTPSLTHALEETLGYGVHAIQATGLVAWND